MKLRKLRKLRMLRKLVRRGRQMLQKEFMWIYFIIRIPRSRLDGKEWFLKVGRDWDVWRMKNNLRFAQDVELSMNCHNLHLAADTVTLKDLGLRTGDRIDVKITNRPAIRRVCCLGLTGGWRYWRVDEEGRYWPVKGM